MLVDQTFALGTFADGFLFAEVDFLLVIVIIAKIKLNLVLVGQLQLGREGSAHLATKPVQRPDAAVGYQFIRLGQLKLSPAHDFPETKVAVVDLAVEPLVSLLNQSAAFRAAGLELAVIAGDGVAVVGLGRLDDPVGHRANLVHERLPVEISALNFLELKLPVAGQFRSGQSIDFQRHQQRDQRARLRSRDQFAHLAHHVLVADQFLDDRRARSRRAETLFAHRLA